MKKVTKAQVLALAILVIILVLLWGWISGYMFGFNYNRITSPVLFFAIVIGLFLLSRQAAKRIFKTKRNIDYYVFISCLTTFSYFVAWVMIGFVKDAMGQSCVGLFGASVSCVTSQFLPAFTLVLPVAIGATIFPIIAYIIFGGEKMKTSKRNENHIQKVLITLGTAILILSPFVTYFFTAPLTTFYCSTQEEHDWCGLIDVYIVGAILFICLALTGSSLILTALLRKRNLSRSKN